MCDVCRGKRMGMANLVVGEEGNWKKGRKKKKAEVGLVELVPP